MTNDTFFNFCWYIFGFNVSLVNLDDMKTTMHCFLVVGAGLESRLKFRVGCLIGARLYFNPQTTIP